MARVGRPANAESSVKFTVYLPVHIYDNMIEELREDHSGKPRYGSRSALVTQLVSQWLRSRTDIKARTTRVATADIMDDIKL